MTEDRVSVPTMFLRNKFLSALKFLRSCADSLFFPLLDVNRASLPSLLAVVKKQVHYIFTSLLLQMIILGVFFILGELKVPSAQIATQSQGNHAHQSTIYVLFP